MVYWHSFLYIMLSLLQGMVPWAYQMTPHQIFTSTYYVSDPVLHGWGRGDRGESDPIFVLQ